MGPTLKTIVISLLTLFILGCGEESAQKNKPQTPQVLKDQKVEAACGSCKFGLPFAGQCALAIKIDNNAYFVDGVDSGDHASYHQPEGYCMVVREAIVSGNIINKRFSASTYDLQPYTTPKQ